MKRFATIVAISASFLLAGAISAAAQDEHRDREQREVGKEERHDAHQEQRHEVHEEQRAEERHVVHEEHVAHEERHAELRRISDEHFRAHFGREHYFAVGHVTMVAGHPHFAYGGYRFEIGQPWPARWAYTDHCYIDFAGGGYFLFNPRYPGVRVAVAVVP
ncbi:MAG TPA: hypothetical protein VK930_01875 [Verrucomicrobiae bacterium]|jgi:hypothetical protein|nr:hypothetical protein [Verrucomicrobiae bacterium]